MIQEQEALGEKRELMKAISGEGEDSPLRTHLAKQIGARLQEEKLRETQDGLDIQQRCMNIRKSLGVMQASRRDLSEHKRKAHEVLVGPVNLTPAFEGLSMDMHGLFGKNQE